MQVGIPDTGTGEPEGSPHRRPNRVALLTDEKIAALLAARPPVCRDSKPDWQCVPVRAL